MSAITTREQWLDAAMPFVLLEVEAAYDADDYNPGLHGLLLAMPIDKREQLPKYAEIVEYWGVYYGPDQAVRPGHKVLWGPQYIARHCVLAWLRVSILDGDLDTLADATSLAVPNIIGTELASIILDAVEDLLASWDAGGIDEFAGLELVA